MELTEPIAGNPNKEQMIELDQQPAARDSKLTLDVDIFEPAKQSDDIEALRSEMEEPTCNETFYTKLLEEIHS